MAKRFLGAMLVATVGSLPGAGGSVAAIDVQDNFRIGSSGNAVCSAQSTPSDKVLSDMFDRGYALVCRDAALPVGRLYVLRLRGGDPAARVAAARAEAADCDALAPGSVEALGPVETASCRLKELQLPYRAYMHREGDRLYVAEGLAAYDSALRLGLRSLVANRVVPGEVSFATTGIGDPVAFARVQAGAISPQQARIEAYRRNNSGDYAEAAEFFAALGGDTNRTSRPEALANEALQKSNLGSFLEADILLGRAAQLVQGDPVVERQLRNYRVMHLLNQGKVRDAFVELDRPMPAVDPGAGAALRQLTISRETAERLSSETRAARRLGASGGLSPEEKAMILDAQATQLRGSALRLDGKSVEGAAALRSAGDQLASVRGGRVAATFWMQAQILDELADISEAAGNVAEAEARHRAAVAIVELHYPGSSTLMSTKGRLAAFLARTGRSDEALAMFREIVTANAEAANGSPALRPILGSYFGLLTRDGASAAETEDLFRASQLLLRPGVAQTQAILARELSDGSDEAARLFRQSLNLSRDVERMRVEIARLKASTAAADARKLPPLQADIQRVQADQIATQAQLAQYPRYRALANSTISLADLQAMLRPGEAYYKMVVLGSSGSYGLFVTPSKAQAFPIGLDGPALERQVNALRDTISKPEDGQLITLPFDVEGAHALYQALFGPAAAELAQVKHLIFEPDGAMLRLPPNLLVMDRASVDLYAARAARPNDDGFDFRGVAWLGRSLDISTSVSAPAFRDLRRAAPSRARSQYIGFGQNQPADAFFLPASAAASAAKDQCAWSLADWGRPISADELTTARQVISGRGEGQADVVTGKAFTDEAIKQRGDLDQYRIVHFATHGMLAPPRPECPARPALMTSFGGSGSDGLLSFGEIFDLRLDADVVILSACDTAGRASFAANRDAGLVSGGEAALDGLVRAFIGAGGRMVIASHWPVPDDFDATKRLISGLFTAPPGTSTAAALRAAETALMDDANTSHPFYWSGFAVVGDGAATLVRPGGTQTASLR